MDRKLRDSTNQAGGKMKTWRAEATAAGERLVAPLSGAKDRLTEAVGNAQERVSAVHDSAFALIAERPLRAALIAFAAGLIVGAALAHGRNGWNGHWR